MIPHPRSRWRSRTETHHGVSHHDVSLSLCRSTRQARGQRLELLFNPQQYAGAVLGLVGGRVELVSELGQCTGRQYTDQHS